MNILPPSEAAVILVDGPADAKVVRIWTDTTGPSLHDMTRRQRLVFATRLRDIAQDLEMYDLIGLAQPTRLEE